MRTAVYPILSSLALYGLAQAGHIPLAAHHHNRTLSTRSDNARLSYYDITVNEVACGGWYKPSDWVVALNFGQFDGGAHCGKKISVNWQGKEATVTIVDECPAPCPYGALDLTEGLFDFFAGSTAPGLLWQASWDYVDDKPKPPPPPPPPSTTKEPPPPPTTTKPPPPKTTEHSTTKTSSSTTESSSTHSSSSSSSAVSSGSSTSSATDSSTTPASTSSSALAVATSSPASQHAISNLMISFGQVAALDAVGSKAH